jgi:hypothetical protein
MTPYPVDQICVQLDELTPDQGTPTTWHLVMPEGVFFHPLHGKLDFRAPFFSEVIRNFESGVRGQDVPIDLHHENKEAGGWVKQLEHRAGEGLFALIEWTTLGVDKVKNKLLRYFSAEFGVHTDPKTRTKYPNTMSAITLTNFPFLKNQPGIEVQLSELATLDETAEAYLLEEYAGVADEDFAGPHRSFPIRTQNDVKDAWDLRGHAADPEAVGRKIVAIAKRKGLTPPDGATEHAAMAEMCPECDKPMAECTCDESMSGEKELALPPAADPNADPNDPKNKKKPTPKKRPAGNEGAHQPGMMHGPKPSITRGRSPDPSSEQTHMTEQNTNTEGTVLAGRVRRAEGPHRPPERASG